MINTKVLPNLLLHIHKRFTEKRLELFYKIDKPNTHICNLIYTDKC